MKKLLILCLCCLVLTACASQKGANFDTASNSTLSVTNEPTTSPVITEHIETEENTAKVTIFSPDENFESFVMMDVFTEEINADIILHELIHAVPLNHDIQVNAFTHEENTLTLDLSSEFADQLRSQGSTGERMIMGCIVNTYLQAYGADYITITVDGKILESGHIVYDFPMEFYK